MVIKLIYFGHTQLNYSWNINIFATNSEHHLAFDFIL